MREGFDLMGVIVVEDSRCQRFQTFYLMLGWVLDSISEIF